MVEKGIISPLYGYKKNDNVIYLILLRYGFIITTVLLTLHWLAFFLKVYADIDIPFIPISKDAYVDDFIWSMGMIYGFFVLPLLTLYGIPLAIKNIRPDDYEVLEAKTIPQKEKLKDMSDRKRTVYGILMFPIFFVFPVALVGIPKLLIDGYGLLGHSLPFLILMSYLSFVICIGSSYGPTAAFIIVRSLRNKRKGIKS